MKVRWCERFPHAPSAFDVLPEEGLRGGWIYVELSIEGGFGMSHLDSGEAEDVGNEKSDEGESENW